MISVSLPVSDLEGPGTDSISFVTSPWSLCTKLLPKKTAPMRIVMMTRNDYLRYWARDVQGRYVGSAPEGEGPRIGREMHSKVGDGDHATGADVKSRGAEDRLGG